MYGCFFNGDMAIQDVRGLFEMELHTHNAIEFNMVKKGSAFYTVGNENFNLNPGDMLIVDSLCIHRAVVDDPNTILTGIDVTDPNIRTQLNRIINDEQRYCIVSQNKLANAVYYDILSLFYDPNSLSNITLGLVYLVDLINRYQSNDIVARIKKYVIDNYTHIYSLDDIAEEFNFSKSHLQRLFKQQTGIPIGNYINNVKLQNACGILINSEKTIDMIHSAAGFKSYRAFLHLFERAYHMSPKEFRKTHSRKK